MYHGNRIASSAPLDGLCGFFPVTRELVPPWMRLGACIMRRSSELHRISADTDRGEQDSRGPFRRTRNLPANSLVVQNIHDWRTSKANPTLQRTAHFRVSAILKSRPPPLCCWLLRRVSFLSRRRNSHRTLDVKFPFPSVRRMSSFDSIIQIASPCSTSIGW